MATGKVLPFPSGNGGSSAFGAGFGAANTAPNVAEAAGMPATPAPTLDQLHARMGNTLELARRATQGLVGRAVPGSVEIGLFNQYGVIQNALAQLAARAAQATGSEELVAIGTDLESVEKQTADFATAADAALANAPDVPAIVAPNKKLLWIGGSLAALVVVSGAYFYLRKPKNRRALKGLFGTPAAK